MRTVSFAGSPTTVLARRSRSAIVTASTRPRGTNDAADRRAFLPGLDRHLACDLLEEVKLWVARFSFGTEKAKIERVRLHREADCILDYIPVLLEAAARDRRASEGDDVLSGQVIKKIARATGDQL